ncbi:MAG: fibrillarin-like rRNA/tRNA 2'-O-methyltransferase, partial [Candidatus Bathyarchaeia archaeon]
MLSRLQLQKGSLNVKRRGENGNVQVKVKPHPHFPAIYQVTLEDGAQRLATKNLAPGRNVYGERLICYEG